MTASGSHVPEVEGSITYYQSPTLLHDASSSCAVGPSQSYLVSRSTFCERHRLDWRRSRLSVVVGWRGWRTDHPISIRHLARGGDGFAVPYSVSASRRHRPIGFKRMCKELIQNLCWVNLSVKYLQEGHISSAKPVFLSIVGRRSQTGIRRHSLTVVGCLRLSAAIHAVILIG